MMLLTFRFLFIPWKFASFSYLFTNVSVAAYRKYKLETSRAFKNKNLTPERRRLPIWRHSIVIGGREYLSGMSRP